MHLSVYSVNDALLQTSSNVNSPSAAGNRHFWDMLARVNPDFTPTAIVVCLDVL